MLQLPNQYRRLLWNRADWSDALTQLGLDLRERSGRSSEFAELADLSCSIVPNASVAIELYCRAYDVGHDERWADRASELALQCGDFARVARIADLRHRSSGDPVHLKTNALGLIDAGLIHAARAPLQLALDDDPGDSQLTDLAQTVRGANSELAHRIEELASFALSGGPDGNVARLLLYAARLARLSGDEAKTETLLLHAFEAQPSNRTVRALLENRWIASQQWERLCDFYRMQTEHAATPLAEVDILRRAGTRLILGSDSPGTGVRLLQQATSIVFQRQLEALPEFLAMVGLLTDVLAQTGGAPRAIRVLAHALAHPRSDDEAMWILNRGLELAAGDMALRRTVQNFEVLRKRLLANETALLEDGAAAEIGDEVSERENPSSLGPDVADRAFVAADVSISLRAEISTTDGKTNAVTRDMSATGLFLACETTLEQDDEICISVLMPGEDDWSLTRHELAGVIVRVVPDIGYGVRLTKVPDQYRTDVQALCEH